MIATAFATCAILALEKRGFRPLEAAIATLVGVIGACYLGELLIAPQDWQAAAFHLVVPQIPDHAALTIVVGIIGATIMPHTLYLHSGSRRIVQRRATTQSGGGSCVSRTARS